MTDEASCTKIIEEDELNYIFLERANEYLRTYDGVLAYDTHHQLSKRYRRLAKFTKILYDLDLISTLDPAALTAEDVKVFYVQLRKKGLSLNGIDHEISAISTLCKYYDNECVKRCKLKYPAFVKKEKHDVLDIYTEDQYITILRSGLRYDEHHFKELRGYAAVCLSLCGGLRHKEVQYAKIANINFDLGTIFLDAVKGDMTYGSKRIAPIRPECLPILTKYVECLRVNDIDSEYLFSNRKTREPLAEKSIRRIIEVVERDVGFRINFQFCRRTYAQLAVDDDVPLGYMTIALGHSSRGTTENFYVKLRQQKIVTAILKVFREHNKLNQPEEEIQRRN